MSPTSWTEVYSTVHAWSTLASSSLWSYPESEDQWSLQLPSALRHAPVTCSKGLAWHRGTALPLLVFPTEKNCHPTHLRHCAYTSLFWILTAKKAWPHRLQCRPHLVSSIRSQTRQQSVGHIWFFQSNRKHANIPYDTLDFFPSNPKHASIPYDTFDFFHPVLNISAFRRPDSIFFVFCIQS